VDQAVAFELAQSNVEVGRGALEDEPELGGARGVVEDRERGEASAIVGGERADAVGERGDAAAALGEVVAGGARVGELEEQERIAAAAARQRRARGGAVGGGCHPRGQGLASGFVEGAEVDPQRRAGGELLGERRAPCARVVLAGGRAREADRGRATAVLGEARANGAAEGRDRMGEGVENVERAAAREAFVAGGGAQADDRQAGEAGAGLELLEEAALADPDGAVGDDQPGRAEWGRRVAREGEVRGRLRELVGAAEERRLGDVGRVDRGRVVGAEDARGVAGAAQA
jgi:hypothetical protein